MVSSGSGESKEICSGTLEQLAEIVKLMDACWEAPRAAILQPDFMAEYEGCDIYAENEKEKYIYEDSWVLVGVSTFKCDKCGEEFKGSGAGIKSVEHEKKNLGHYCELVVLKP